MESRLRSARDRRRSSCAERARAGRRRRTAACPPSNRSRAVTRRSTPKSGIALDAGDRAGRFGVEQPARERDRIAADVEQRAAAPFDAAAHIVRIAAEVAEVSARRDAASPMRPSRMSRRTSSHCGCVRTMNASAIVTPLRSRASTSARASAALSAIGFSQSTCLPASAARIVHGTCR